MRERHEKYKNTKNKVAKEPIFHQKQHLSFSYNFPFYRTREKEIRRYDALRYCRSRVDSYAGSGEFLVF